jgi:hypothetical protein
MAVRWRHGNAISGTPLVKMKLRISFAKSLKQAHDSLSPSMQLALPSRKLSSELVMSAHSALILARPTRGETDM